MTLTSNASCGAQLSSALASEANDAALAARGYIHAAGDAGDLVVGWPRQANFLRAKYDAVPLWQRRPTAAWRGRMQDPEHPWRDELRWV